VTIFINDREIATLKLNEVNVVLFKDVKLSKGVNTVTVKSGNLVKTCSWVRGNTSK
jgi:hypothetical protein